MSNYFHTYDRTLRLNANRFSWLAFCELFEFPFFLFFATLILHSSILIEFTDKQFCFVRRIYLTLGTTRMRTFIFFTTHLHPKAQLICAHRFLGLNTKGITRLRLFIFLRFVCTQQYIFVLVGSGHSFPPIPFKYPS